MGNPTVVSGSFAGSLRHWSSGSVLRKGGKLILSKSEFPAPLGVTENAVGSL